MALVFSWERSERVAYLLAAVAVLVVGIQFHTLAVFGAFMVFFPDSVRGDLNKFLLGMLAFALIVAGFFGVDHWIATQYPSDREVASEGEGIGGPKAGDAIPALGILIPALAAIAATAVAAFLVRHVKGRVAAISSGALLALGLLAQAAFSYHLALLLIVAGLVVAIRARGISFQRVLILAAVSGVIAAVQIYILHSNGVESTRQLFGALAGRPSVWPFITIADYSIVAALVVALAVVVGVWQLARRRPILDFLLLMVLGVWLPLVIIGVFKWSISASIHGSPDFPAAARRVCGGSVVLAAT